MKLSPKITAIVTIVLGINLAVPFFAFAQSVPYSYSFQFGTIGSGDGQLFGTGGLTVDAAGKVYVTDAGNSRIEIFDASGNYVSQFSGGLTNPRGIGVDSAGNIYVVGLTDNRVEKFDSSGVYQSQFGSAGTGDGQFNGPSAMTLDSAGNIYVVDESNNRVQKFDSSGTFKFKFGTAGAGDGQFNAPKGIALDNLGNIYVADGNNNRVEKFNSSGVYQSQFGSAGSGDGQFSIPSSVAINTNGDILVGDSGNNRVQIFDSSGVYQSQFGSTGSGDGQFNGSGQTPKSPSGIDFGPTGNVYVSDQGNFRIEVFAPVAAPGGTSSVGQGEEIINPGILQLTSVPANFNFPPITITDFQTYNTIYQNAQGPGEKLTAEDKRFSGGFEVQMTATDYVGQNNPSNSIAVSNLGALTELETGTEDYSQTDKLDNNYSSSEGTLIAGSQANGAVISQTLPFNVTMYGHTGNVIYICTSGLVIHGADLLSYNPSDFTAVCQNTGPPPSGAYGIMLPYYEMSTSNALTTETDSTFDSNNGVYYNEVSSNEVHLRWKANIRNVDGHPAGDVEFNVSIFKDGRIEYHFGPITDFITTPTIAIYDNNTGVPVLASVPPFDTMTSGLDVANAQIRFSPTSTVFSETPKPDTPPVYSPILATPATDTSNYTMFTEDSMNPGFSVPMVVFEGSACSSQGRLGNYTVYPSFLLQIPGTTPADTYQNTITFTIIDKTIADGTSFCP